MHSEFKHIKKEGYGIVHVHNLGAFIVLPLKAGSDLAKIGAEKHKAALKKKTAKKKTATKKTKKTKKR